MCIYIYIERERYIHTYHIVSYCIVLCYITSHDVLRRARGRSAGVIIIISIMIIMFIISYIYIY